MKTKQHKVGGGGLGLRRGRRGLGLRRGGRRVRVKTRWEGG